MSALSACDKHSARAGPRVPASEEFFDCFLDFVVTLPEVIVLHGFLQSVQMLTNTFGARNFFLRRRVSIHVVMKGNIEVLSKFLLQPMGWAIAGVGLPA